MSTFERSDIESQIEQLSLKLGFNLTAHQLWQAGEFIHMLFKWNQVYNFTALKSAHDMVARHWEDSLTIAKLVEGSRVIDVGTGPGLPGLPLSILFEEKKFCLLDSNEKRQIFLQQVVHRLGLKNVRLHQGRVEGATFDEKYDCIISRAFKPLPKLLKLTKHLLADEGLMLAMKGAVEQEELEGLDQDFELEKIVQLDTHQADRPRQAVLLRFKQGN